MSMNRRNQIFEGEDKWLDDALAGLQPPPVSDTLRARLLRDFQAPVARQSSLRPAPGMMQAAAVAAVLVLAVALAVVAPAPVSQPTAVSYVTADSVPVLAPEEEEAVRAALALIDDGPDISDVQLALTWPGDGTGAESSGLLDGLPLD